MKEIFICKLTLLFLLVFLAQTGNAQITIGSAEKPNLGALLDLKENALKGANSSKGLGMPKVALSNRTELHPLNDGSDENEQASIGMIVYNMTERDIENNRICKGLHVWTGVEWEPISPYPTHPSIAPNASKTGTIVDPNDGTQYPIVWIGDGQPININQYSCDPNAVPTPGSGGTVEGGYAAWWIARDLMNTKSQDGKLLSASRALTINPAWSSLGTSPNYNKAITFSTLDELKAMSNTFTYKEDGVTKTVTPYQFALKFGAKYTFEQSMRACPEGWYVPTIDDMDALVGYYIDHLNLGLTTITARVNAASRYLKGDNILYTAQNGTTPATSWNSEQPHTGGRAMPYSSGFNAVTTGHTQPLTPGTDIEPYLGNLFTSTTGWWLSTIGGSFNMGIASGNYIPGRDNGVEGLGLTMRCLKKDVASGIEFVYDREGTPYMTADFGAAGRWMVQNLRTAKTPNGTAIAGYSSAHTLAVQQYRYPGGPVTGGAAGTNQNLRFSHGYLYNWAAATNGSTASINQGFGTADEDKQIQGICPTGWHLPTDKEWSELEKSIFENTNYYATVSAGIGTWLTSDYTSNTGARAKLGAAMLSKKNEVTPANPTYGISILAEKGGFDVQPLGYARVAVFDGHYGTFAHFWTSSALNASSAWYRDIVINGLYSARNAAGKDHFFSVRCKKNNSLIYGQY